ncbi:beta/alpha barrel domain-containing protein [Rudanella paleaurantiibacter]|nr:bifunctional 4-hydroxy-2-oxoglutarate aldolase/2-dehydro-3-deoxy-phosphogluconate aldolase [Rudanella paleaurantiibacter]
MRVPLSLLLRASSNGSTEPILPPVTSPRLRAGEATVALHMMTTTEQLLQAGIVPVFSHPDAETSVAVVAASYAGGIRVFEYTNRNASALDNFRRLVEAKAEQFPQMLLGIGTIWEPAQAHAFIDAGATFVVSPVMNPAVGAVCQERNIPWIPGCMTLTEVYQAQKAGATFVKVFPGEVVGPAFVRSVKSVLPDVQLMITGGVEPTEASLSAWFGAGATAVGMGSQLFNKGAVAQKDRSAIEAAVAGAMQVYQQVQAR